MDHPVKKSCLTKEVLECTYNHENKTYFVKTDGAQVKICFMTHDIVRVRASFDG